MNKLLTWYHNSPHFRRFFEVFIASIAIDTSIQLFLQTPEFTEAALHSVMVALAANVLKAIRIAFFLPKD